MVRVVTHQRREIKCNGEAATAVIKQVFVALIGLFRRSKTRELPHRIELAAVTSGVNAAREGCLSGVAEVLFVVPIRGQVGLRVQTANRHTGNGGEARISVVIEVDTGWFANRAFRRLLQRGSESLFCPVFFGFARMTP